MLGNALKNLVFLSPPRRIKSKHITLKFLYYSYCILFIFIAIVGLEILHKMASVVVSPNKLDADMFLRGLMILCLWSSITSRA